jgi:GH15 family glucan-1,4-alpha-glucosidase
VVAGRIEDYALVGDMHTAALVGRDGSIDWLCLPRFDSGACFAALLGSEENGCWRIAPAGAGSCTRRSYRGESLILETIWETTSGSVRLLDFMPPRDDQADLVRIVEGVSGSVSMESVLRLRFDYGRVVPWVHRRDGQLVAVAGPDSVWIDGDVPMHGEADRSSRAEFTVGPGDRVGFVMSWNASHLPAPRRVNPHRALHGTQTYWSDWIRKCTYEGPWQDAVRRSLITLKALTYEPTGGIVAAATTSLPEDLGGVRNWDYRYCWLRDATITLSALLSTGFTEEAKAWREWLLRAVAGDARDVQIMYGVAGERRLAEYELPWLPGYEHSAPVRVGNNAVDQLQLDVFGEVTDALTLSRTRGLASSEHVWDLQKLLLDFLESHWASPDEGLWEIRGPRRDFVHSKVMAWVAFDRAVQTVEQHGLAGPVEKWRVLRDQVHGEVCARGFDGERNTFTQYYGSAELDASLLLIPQVGFLPPTDPRVIGTVEAIQRELTEDGFVRRYSTPGVANASVDGLPGGEGAFLACSFWLADDLAMIGRRDEATELFERLLDLRNDVGLLAEEWDPKAGRQVGNTPQAFSHVPLVVTAQNLSGNHSPRTARSGHGWAEKIVRRLADHRDHHNGGTGHAHFGHRFGHSATSAGTATEA